MGILKICHNFNKHIYKTLLLRVRRILVEVEMKGLGGGGVVEVYYVGSMLSFEDGEGYWWLNFRSE